MNRAASLEEATELSSAIINTRLQSLNICLETGIGYKRLRNQKQGSTNSRLKPVLSRARRGWNIKARINRKENSTATFRAEANFSRFLQLHFYFSA